MGQQHILAYLSFCLQAVAEILGEDGMTTIELEDAFKWFQKASGVQVGTNDIRKRWPTLILRGVCRSPSMALFETST